MRIAIPVTLAVAFVLGVVLALNPGAMVFGVHVGVLAVAFGAVAGAAGIVVSRRTAGGG